VINDNESKQRQKVILGMKVIFGFIGLIVLTIAGCNSVETVKTGHVGIKVAFGEVEPEELPAGGPYFINPFSTDIVEIDTRTVKWSGELNDGYTKDVQQARTTFTATYNLDRKNAAEVFDTVGEDWAAKLIGQVIYEDIKRELGRHNAVDIIADRDKAARNIETNVRKRLGERHVILTGLELTGIKFEPKFEHSVEEKVIAEQNALAEQNKTVQIKELAIQKIETAEGDKQSKILNAQGEAESIRLKNEALASAPKLIEYQTILEWDGAMPQTLIVGDSKAIPFINVPNTK
jgi:regulator of protease activity HflC (stomatin/prohibitin superfamily)